jgi:hypothetical protein
MPITMVTDHPFEARHPEARRCEHLFTDQTLCGHPRVMHTRTANVPVRVRRPAHPRDTEIYQATTRVPGLDVAVDQSGQLVLFVVSAGAYTIDNLDGLIADLEQARAHAKRFALHPELYRGLPPELVHAKNGQGVALLGRLDNVAVHNRGGDGRDYASAVLTLDTGEVAVFFPATMFRRLSGVKLAGRQVALSGRLSRSAEAGVRVDVTSIKAGVGEGDPDADVVRVP